MADTSFLDKYETAPASFLDKYEVKQPAAPASENPFAMMGEGEEVGAQGNAAMAPTVLPIAGGIAGDTLGGPAGGALGYLGVKAAMPETRKDITEHPVRTAVETGLMAAAPGLLGKLGEMASPYVKKLGELGDFFPKSGVGGMGEVPETLAPAAVETPKPVTTPKQGELPLHGGPLFNLETEGKVITPAKPQPTLNDIFQGRPVMGTVGAKTVGEFPNPEAPLGETSIKTPSRTDTLMGRVQPLEPGTPLKEQPAAFTKPGLPKDETIHPMDRQIIHSDGATMFKATEGKPELREDLHALRGPQLMEVLRKSGEDVGEKIAGGLGKTASSPTNYSRNEIFEILLNEKGYTPEQILKEAPTAEEMGLKTATRRKSFGPER